MQSSVQLVLRMMLGVGGLFFLLAALTVPQAVSAIDFLPSGSGDPCAVQPDAVACSGRDDNITGTDGIILQAAGLIAIVAGIAAVIAIIVSGIMFITAAGDSNKISTARNIIIYAVVGLIVIFLARTVVVFVVKNI
jgi:hypothetical protein